MRAIVIEDDLDIQKQIVERLQQEGFAVDSTTTGSVRSFSATRVPL